MTETVSPPAALPEAERPLAGLLVLDLSQFLAGPSAAMRLADLGARVIKIERPGSGDLCRQLYISNLALDGDSTLFHSINRNKESYAADLKRPADLAAVKDLVTRADVLIQNFRPGVIAWGSTTPPPLPSTRALSTARSPATATVARGETSPVRTSWRNRSPG